MTQEKSYVNKFHNFKFKTDTEKDMELNQPSISKDLNEQKVNDHFSNELAVDYINSAEGEDIGRK